jgi:hypothetical protein
MIKKDLLAASVLLPLIAVSGTAYAGPQWNPTMAPWNTAQVQQLVSKPYAQYVAPQVRVHSTGPKSTVTHVQRW